VQSAAVSARIFCRSADTIALGIGCVASGPLALIIQIALQIGTTPQCWQWISCFEAAADAAGWVLERLHWFELIVINMLLFLSSLFCRSADTIALGIGCVASGPLALIIQIALQIGTTPKRWQWIGLSEAAGLVLVQLLTTHFRG
jgi:hypothetical protein